MPGKTSLPLLMCAGLLLDRRLWEPVVPALADLAEIQVADLTIDDSIAGMAARALAAAPERFALAGLSMGGYVAQEIVFQAPERVSRLALLDTRAGLDSEENRARRRGLMELAQKGHFKGVTPKLLPALIHPDRLTDKTLTDNIMAQAESVGQAAFLRQQKAILGRRDFRPLLPKAKMPSLVLCGEQDALTPPSEAAEMASLLPDVRMVVLPDCGHLPPMEKPQETGSLLRQWLTGERVM